MRDLHVVAVSRDGRHVVLAGTKGATTGTYRVRLDARLVAAVRGELSDDEPAVALTPKDIQARLRAGETAEHIAESAGIAVTRVERFAGPVAGEMARMVAEAREAFSLRGRRGPSAVRLGAAVAEALGEPGAWSARREDDGRWRVAVTWHARARTREAAWRYDPARKELTPVDPASAALGHVDAAAPRRTAARPAKAAKPPEPTAPAKPARPAKAAAPAKTPAKAAVKTAAKTAVKTPTPKAAAPARPAAPAKAPTKAPRAKAAPRTPAPARAARPRLRVVPDAAARGAVTADERDGVKGRASVPAWADVLLGTTPGGER